MQNSSTQRHRTDNLSAEYTKRQVRTHKVPLGGPGVLATMTALPLLMCHFVSLQCTMQTALSPLLDATAAAAADVDDATDAAADAALNDICISFP